MGLRDRLESGAARVGEAAKDVAEAGLRRAPDEGFQSLRALFRDDDDQPLSIERFLLALVRTVRDDEREEDRSSRDVFEIARRRRRGLGFVSFGAGPLVGVANQVSDLYCDTATVCDVADLHRLELTDEQVAAHMLVMWGLTESLPVALGAMDGSRPGTLTVLLGLKLADASDLEPAEPLSKRRAAKALWEARERAEEARKSSRKGAVRTVVFTGRHTKQLIAQAEELLGVR